LPFIDNEKQYFILRNKLLIQPTHRQSQVALSAATADIDNDQTNAQLTEPQTNVTKQATKNDTKLIVHYTHEKRFHTLKCDMHQVYDNTFGNTPAMYTTLIVGNRNRRDAKHELIRKRLNRTLLQNTKTHRK
jgi:hypothetical protein